jgi:hypothetical protein
VDLGGHLAEDRLAVLDGNAGLAESTHDPNLGGSGVYHAPDVGIGLGGFVPLLQDLTDFGIVRNVALHDFDRNAAVFILKTTNGILDRLVLLEDLVHHLVRLPIGVHADEAGNRRCRDFRLKDVHFGLILG